MNFLFWKCELRTSTGTQKIRTAVGNLAENHKHILNKGAALWIQIHCGSSILSEF
jgi:hypothetical protein